MEPSKGSIYDLLNGIKQYIVPVYQRRYSWLKNEQCARLWKDIIAMVRSGKRYHFVGSVVNISESRTPMGIQKYLVIDGQQRMTTLSILMISLRDYLYDNPSDDVSPEDLTAMLLKNIGRKGDERYKMILTGKDKDILINLIERLPIADKDKESNIYQNYQYFYERIKEGVLSPINIYNSIAQLQIISITLNREDGDDPQAIFESLNSTGMDLSASDLIRNYLLMGLTNDEQEDIYNHFWSPMEELFPVDKRSENMDYFFRDYLTMKTGRIPKFEKVYDAFKEYYSNHEFNDTKELAQDIFVCGGYYADIAFGECKDAVLERIFSNIRTLRMEVAYPFLIKVYRDYAAQIITKEVFIQILTYCESYVIRRAICGIPTNSLNSTFASMKNAIRADDYLNSIKAAFIQLDSYKEYPKDIAFGSNLKGRDIYNIRINKYILSRIENFDNKEPIDLSGFTIEHIMPQNEKLNKAWQDALGENWKEIQANYLHRLGNLTLTGYNSEMGDRPFEEKLPIFKQGATHHLNKYVIEQTTWNSASIEERARQLVDIAIKIWPYPSLTSDEMKPYIPVTEEPVSKYSLDSYDFSNAFVRMLYDKLDESICKMYPGIKREYKKLYIAYKAKTNVVDIIVQKSRLRLTVNMAYPEVYDPTNICRDITDLGRWGNGDIEIDFDTLAILEDTMKIIEQSLKKQL